MNNQPGKKLITINSDVGNCLTSDEMNNLMKLLDKLATNDIELKVVYTAVANDQQ